MLYPFPPLVLLIDVDNINTPICEKVILHLGFSVTHIPSCVGFGYLGGAKPAAVVLDAQCCPNVFETLALIEKQFPEAALIVIVGRDQHVQARFAVRLGANHVMTKPCAVAEIEEIFRFVAEHGAYPATSRLPRRPNPRLWAPWPKSNAARSYPASERRKATRYPPRRCSESARLRCIGNCNVI